MIDRDHDLSLRHQADILQISRSSLYYVPVEISAADLELMRKIDLLHTDYPFMGARMLRDRLKALGYSVGRRHVARLMRRMGIEALYRKKRTTKRNPEHPVFPYLLRGLTIDRPNQVWAADISYIPMRRGFLYLFAVLDWATRRVLAWRLSNTLTTDFCIETVQDAIAEHGRPEVFNTDQGSQFTDADFVELIRKKHGIALSMDGKGCWRDNVFMSASGARSNTRKSICMRTRALRKRAQQSASTSRSTTARDRTRRLTGVRRTRHTSLHRPSNWRLNLRRFHLRTSYPQLEKPGPPLSLQL